jgi:hypothetical protein
MQKAGHELRYEFQNSELETGEALIFGKKQSVCSAARLTPHSG